MPASTPPASYRAALLATVKTTFISPVNLDWLVNVLYILDQKDVESYCSFMAPDVTVTFNNGNDTEPNMSGVTAVKAGLGQFWQTFKSVLHEEVNIFESGGTIMHEALNHYETLDGRKVSLRAVAILERNEQGLIQSLRVYSDQSPLFQSS
jgi:ketosteroid isomerase-like protein